MQPGSSPSTLPLTSVQATTVTVANLYYVQPILFKIADTFDVTFEKASSVATLLQAGYAAGLLFLCPLGDIFPRRPYILVLIFFTATMVGLPQTRVSPAALHRTRPLSLVILVACIMSDS